MAEQTADFFKNLLEGLPELLARNTLGSLKVEVKPRMNQYNGRLKDTYRISEEKMKAKLKCERLSSGLGVD